MSLHVRPLEARDHAAWIRLFKGYIEFYKATVAEDVIATTWERLINREPGSPVGLVAVDATDAPLGLAHVLFHRSTWSATWYCYLEDLFVDPARRKAGAGRALIEAVYREADARGCTRTYWMTQEFNDTGPRAVRPGGDQGAVRAISAVSWCQTPGLTRIQYCLLALRHGVRPGGSDTQERCP